MMQALVHAPNYTKIQKKYESVPIDVYFFVNYALCWRFGDGVEGSLGRLESLGNLGNLENLMSLMNLGKLRCFFPIFPIFPTLPTLPKFLNLVVPKRFTLAVPTRFTTGFRALLYMPNMSFAVWSVIRSTSCGVV